MSFGNQVPLGRYGATNRTCSKSSLILHSVCACRLTWGNAFLRRPWCQLCASASVPSVASDREQNHWAVGGYCGRSVTQEHSGTVPSPAPSCQRDTARDDAPGPLAWTSHDPETVRSPSMLEARGPSQLM